MQQCTHLLQAASASSVAPLVPFFFIKGAINQLMLSPHGFWDAGTQCSAGGLWRERDIRDNLFIWPERKEINIELYFWWWAFGNIYLYTQLFTQRFSVYFLSCIFYNERHHLINPSSIYKHSFTYYF